MAGWDRRRSSGLLHFVRPHHSFHSIVVVRMALRYLHHPVSITDCCVASSIVCGGRRQPGRKPPFPAMSEGEVRNLFSSFGDKGDEQIYTCVMHGILDCWGKIRPGKKIPFRRHQKKKKKRSVWSAFPDVLSLFIFWQVPRHLMRNVTMSRGRT